MKVFVEFDEVLLSKVLNECAEQKVEFEVFVMAAIREKLEEPEDSGVRDFDVAKTVAKAVAIASELATDSEFHIDSICPPSDWNALNGGERKIFGKAFRKAVEGSNPPVAVHVGRTSGNKAIYRRA